MLNSFVLHLSLIENVGPVTVNLILKNCLGFDKNLPTPDYLSSPDSSENLKTKLAKLYNYSSIDWLNQLGCSSKIAEKLSTGLRDQTILLQELDLIAKSQVSNKSLWDMPASLDSLGNNSSNKNKLAVNWLTIVDPKYPKLLKQLPNAPVVLYWWGDYNNLVNKSLAVVGSRQANNYAWQVITDLVPKLIVQNWVVVSGGAIGADTMAHRITVQNHGRTVAVLGSGLLQAYPASNKQLFQDIVANQGTILSPFSLNRPAMVGNFPARNNIISGLSLGTIVVQAAIKSGARITADCALSQGRELFVIPGLYGDDLSAGCHALVSEGAKLVHSVQDILVEFEPDNAVISNLKNNSSQNLNILENLAQASINRSRSLLENSNPKDLRPVIGGHSEPLSTFVVPDLNTQIIIACRKPASTDDLLDQFSALDLDDLQGRLFDLQLNGQIAQNFAGMWQSLNY